MNISDILCNLQRYKASIADKNIIRRIGVFGSVAKGAATPQSDVDIVVELVRQDLFELIGIKQDLEQTFNCKVDIVSYREQMNPFLKRRIEKEAIYV